RHAGEDALDPSQLQDAMDRELRRTRQNGLGLLIDFNRIGLFFHLLLDFGGAGSNVLCKFGDDDLGLPLTRTNPYRLLDGRAAADASGPAGGPGATLERDVVLRQGGNWEAAIGSLASAAGIDVVSD